MIFSSKAFIFAFAPLVILIWWLLPQRFRLGWITLAGYFFYGWWDWRFTGLLLATTLLEYWCGAALHRAVMPARRRLWLWAAIGGHLGLLGYFKYAGLLAQTAAALAGVFHLEGSAPVVSIVLPIGISFYTFQSMTYSILLYRRQAKPAASFLHFAAFVSLFPLLIAGPIVRWPDLADQLLNLPRWLNRRAFNLGLTFFMVGLAKKVLIADRVAFYIDPWWIHNDLITTAQAWAAVAGYTVQVYFDFAGYSLMAIGLGCLLGLQLPPNFNSPYQARDISDFWRRWHITLSVWLRDYIFHPLAARWSRGLRRWLPLKLSALWGSLAALFTAFLLCGLWHGAGWTFVIWGIWYGVLHLGHYGLRDGMKIKWRGGRLGQTGTLVLVALGWVFFRAQDLPTAWQMLVRLFDLTGWQGGAVIPAGYFVAVVPALAWSVWGPNTYELIYLRRARPNPWVIAALGIAAAASVLLMSDGSPFIYFQF